MSCVRYVHLLTNIENCLNVTVCKIVLFASSTTIDAWLAVLSIQLVVLHVLVNNVTTRLALPINSSHTSVRCPHISVI